MRVWLGRCLPVLVLGLFACSSSSTGGEGIVTFSCTQTAASLCTQLEVPASEVAAETETCTGIEGGTAGTGCSATGVAGCCKDPSNPSAEEQCYYGASAAMTGKSACTSKGATWSAMP